MGQENILIPLAEDSRDLKALHQAISLAERINSKIIVFSVQPESLLGETKSPVIQACMEVINRARENGIGISLLVTSAQGEGMDGEFLQLLTRERIDLIIISDTETNMERMIRRLMPLIPCHVVQVREKDHISRLTS